MFWLEHCYVHGDARGPSTMDCPNLQPPSASLTFEWVRPCVCVRRD